MPSFSLLSPSYEKGERACRINLGPSLSLPVSEKECVLFDLVAARRDAVSMPAMFSTRFNDPQVLLLLIKSPGKIASSSTPCRQG